MGSLVQQALRLLGESQGTQPPGILPGGFSHIAMESMSLQGIDRKRNASIAESRRASARKAGQGQHGNEPQRPALHGTGAKQNATPARRREEKDRVLLSHGKGPKAGERTALQCQHSTALYRSEMHGQQRDVSTAPEAPAKQGQE